MSLSKLKLIGLYLLIQCLGISAAQADLLAYAVTGNNKMGIVDLTSGEFTVRGDMGQLLTGLGVGIDGSIYGGGYRDGTLYKVNPSNGALTAVGTSALTYWMTGSTNTGLYAIDITMNLYSVNSADGSATLIGPTGISSSAVVEGMSSGADAIYVTKDSALYVLNLTTGAATLVGSSQDGLLGPTVLENGLLYSAAANPSAIYSIDPLTGLATFRTNVSGAETNFWGLAQVAAVPEPSTWMMMLVGFFIIVGRSAIRHPSAKCFPNARHSDSEI